MSAEGLAGALISPILDALAGIVRQHGEARAREEAARVEAMLREPLATPRPIDEVIADARGRAQEAAATEARVSPADLDVMRRMLRGPYLTTEERASVLRVAHWMGARLAIPMPTRLDSEGEP